MRGIILPPPRPNGTFAFGSVLGCEKIGTPKEKLQKMHIILAFQTTFKKRIIVVYFRVEPQGCCCVWGRLGVSWVRLDEERRAEEQREEKRRKANKRGRRREGSSREETG